MSDTTGHGITDGFVERVAYEAMRDKRDKAEAESQRLCEALEAVANRKDGDGLLCWCLTDMRSGLFVPEHSLYCLSAREALAGDAE